MDQIFLIKVISLILYPVGLIVLLVIVGLILRCFHYKRLSQLMWLTSAVVFIIASNPMIANSLVSRLEAQNPQVPIEQLPKRDAILVLGGGLRIPLPPLQHTQIGSGSDRYWYAARLFKAKKADKIILSGGNSYPQPGYSGEAFYAAQLLHEWGIPKQAIIIEQNSRTTAQNADNSVAFLQQQNINSVLLVTSALHMPRAYQLFSKLPITVTPASADVLIQTHQHPAILDWIPSAKAMQLSTVALHEYYGIWANQLMNKQFKK